MATAQEQRGGHNSIQRTGGLRSHINGHSKLGYTFFVDAWKKGVSVADLARLYGKHRNTIKKWILIYKEETKTAGRRGGHEDK